MAKNGNFPGYNCRITAMELFGDFLSAGDSTPVDAAGEDVLFMDEETLRTDPEALGGNSLTDFRALYSAMRAEDTTDVQHHVQAVREEWKSRGISFREPYRLLRFADRTELSDYLMGKYDVSWGQSTARPFIMENDELMEGWRSNPDSADAADH